jgi:hypothetical protein
VNVVGLHRRLFAVHLDGDDYLLALEGGKVGEETHYAARRQSLLHRAIVEERSAASVCKQLLGVFPLVSCLPPCSEAKEIHDLVPVRIQAAISRAAHQLTDRYNLPR